MAELSAEAASAIRNTVYGVTRSNNEALNYMTIPQIKAAREILKTKMNGDLDPTLQNKFKRLDAQYAHAMDKIDKTYNMAVATGGQNVKSLIEGKRDLITIAKIATAPAHLSHLDKKNLDQYTRMDATADFFKELNKGIPLAKVGLGVGIGLAGLGAISLIPGSMGAIGGFLAANPAFTALVASGAALALAVKVVPAIYKAVKKVQENRAAMESAKVDINEKAYEEQEKARKEQEKEDKEEQEKRDKEAEIQRMNSGALTHADFADGKFDKEKMANRLLAEPELYTQLLAECHGMELVNLKTAKLEAKKKELSNKKEEKKVEEELSEVENEIKEQEPEEENQNLMTPEEATEFLKKNKKMLKAWVNNPRMKSTMDKIPPEILNAFMAGQEKQQ